MKKLMAVLCMVALLAMAILPAVAEQNNGMQGQPPQMNQNQGGPNGGAPSMPGNGQSGDQQTPPAMPDGDTSGPTDGQTPPAMPSGTDGQNGTQPGEPQEMQDPLKQLVTDGKLSQTTYDAIQNYLKNNASGDDQQTPPARPDGDSTSQGEQQTPPAKPDGNDAGMGPQGQGGMMLNQETLQAMLKDGVITEDEYNVLLAAIAQPADAPVSAGDTETADGADA